MNGRRSTTAVLLALLLLAVFAGQANAAAKSCSEPGDAWERATAEEAGMDGAKLQDAIDYGTTQLSFAVRVYRNGCLVGEDRGAPLNRNLEFESWSMAKSVTSLIFGRAMTKGLIQPEDPVGSLLPEADSDHGRISALELLTMTSGLEWNGLRDYNVFTMPDRVHDALTLGVAHPPGTYYEYAQSAVALLAEMTGRAAGEDPQEFLQRELLTPLGIDAADWRWTRDPAGHIEGFKGVNMRPDDFGRLGELLRRGGLWRGRRLLSEEYVRRATTASETNGCYGWLIWTNDAKPCIGPTVTERGVDEARRFPELPADLYNFSGLFGQLVTVFPSQGIVVVRTGQDPSLLPAGGGNWETELYKRVLASITDQTVPVPGDAADAPRSARTEADYGFQTALLHPEEYRQGVIQDPLPPAGPARARAVLLDLGRRRVSSKGTVALRVTCPARGAAERCTGRVRLQGSAKRLAFDLGRGQAAKLEFKLSKRQLALVRRSRGAELSASALNQAAAGSVVVRRKFAVRH